MVVNFALAHLDTADTVQTLWPYVSGYQLPPHLTQTPPEGMLRAAATKVVFRTNLGGVGDGQSFDAAFRLRNQPEDTV